MEVEVLGTHFNVNAYEDEEVVRTTLLQGSVKIIRVPATAVAEGDHARSIILKPGQQAVQSPSVAGITVEPHTKTDQVMAWKNGLFNFKDASFGEIMRQLARWYDIEVVYKKGIPNVQFWGEISRNTSLSGVLKALENSDIKFDLEGNRLLITNQN